MKLLHIDAGITGPNSVSRQLSGAIVEALAKADPSLQIVSRDLDADPIPHLDGGDFGLRAVEGSDDKAARAAAVLQEFLDADIVVIGAPMYNLGIPSQLKAWFDRILVAGKTFRYTANGPEGLSAGKRVIVASARGGLYAPGTPQAAADFHEPYLRTLFAFIGIDEIAMIRAEGVAISPEQRQAAVSAALGSVSEVTAGAVTALAA